MTASWRMLWGWVGLWVVLTTLLLLLPNTEATAAPEFEQDTDKAAESSAPPLGRDTGDQLEVDVDEDGGLHAPPSPEARDTGEQLEIPEDGHSPEDVPGDELAAPNSPGAVTGK
eukprot:RCo022466